MRASSEPAARPRGRPRVLVVDERGIMRDALCALLEASKECEVVGAESSVPEALRASANARANLAIVELSRSARGGSEPVADLKAARPDVRILVLTSRREDHLVDAALRAGADGYVLKNDSRSELFAALRCIAAGGHFISAALRSGVERRDRSGPDAAQGVELSERERQVMQLIAAGHRTREIAALLSLSHKTIEKHRTSLMRKLGLRNASAVAAYAIANRIGER